MQACLQILYDALHLLFPVEVPETDLYRQVLVEDMHLLVPAQPPPPPPHVQGGNFAPTAGGSYNLYGSEGPDRSAVPTNAPGETLSESVATATRPTPFAESRDCFTTMHAAFPVPRCGKQCVWGSWTETPCLGNCRRAVGHDGGHDCLQHPEREGTHKCFNRRVRGKSASMACEGGGIWRTPQGLYIRAQSRGGSELRQHRDSSSN
jgi:hypothetical protein